VSDKIYAPWSYETTAALNSFQRRGEFHPFTCGVDSRHGSLLATANGWLCPVTTCDYRQKWAHAFMAEGPINRQGRPE
jgi:hypothetical protein